MAHKKQQQSNRGAGATTLREIYLFAESTLCIDRIVSTWERQDIEAHLRRYLSTTCVFAHAP